MEPITTTSRYLARIIDVGAVSTRPGSAEVPTAEEHRRLVPHLEDIVAIAGGVVVSIDTFRAEIAEIALAHGVRIVNNVWGVYRPDRSVNRRMLDVVRSSDAHLVLMYNGGTDGAVSSSIGSHYDSSGLVDPPITELVVRDLMKQIDIACDHGVSPERLAIDPGIGFGMTPEQSLILLRNMSALTAIGPPVVLSASRKSVIGYITGAPVHDILRRDAATHAISAFAVAAGVCVVRAHDVAGNVSAIDTAMAMGT